MDFSRRWASAGCTVLVTALLGLVCSAPAASADAGAAAKPAKNDSPKPFKPRGVTLTPSVTPTEARAGDTVTYQVTAKLAPSWHIYKYAKADPVQGPRATKFDFFDTDGLRLSGDWTASKVATAKLEPAFDNLRVEYYEDEVIWSIKLVVPTGTKPGKKTLRCQAGYQVCDSNSCSPPGQWTLPDVTLTVLPGSAVSTEGANALPPTGEAIATAPSAKDEFPAATVAAPVVTTKPVLSEVAQKAQQGIIPFLLASALGGLLALVMPCVWPMVPITVNFFIKQGHANKGGSTTGLAITYCLAIIGVFTAVGVLFSFFFSASALPRLANNPWLNTTVAALFLAFGLSLLGLFEIRLPTFLLNASAKGESRGGLIGVVFMALTLTITSFTCTFPVVGGLLVMAAGGQFFYPIIGLTTFATVLALPFFLLALAPGLLAKMPKSGDWMNAVKIVGGLVEIGAAFKFVNTAEIGFGATPTDAWFDAQVVLSIWVVLAAVCGLYLLGLFRTDHDHDEVKVGPGRLLTGVFFLSVALFLAPALFGNPPKSPLYYALIGLFPPDAGELAEGTRLAGQGTDSAGHRARASSRDPALAAREQKSLHGVVWGMSYDAAREQAKAENRPILIDFTGVNCANCRAMEQSVMPRPEVVEQLGKFVTVQLYTDFVPIASITAEQREELARQNLELQIQLTQDNSNPFYVALSPGGELLGTLGGKRTPSVFVDFLNQALGKHENTEKVAQATPSGG